MSLPDGCSVRSNNVTERYSIHINTSFDKKSSLLHEESTRYNIPLPPLDRPETPITQAYCSGNKRPTTILMATYMPFCRTRSRKSLEVFPSEARVSARVPNGRRKGKHVRIRSWLAW